MKRFVSAMFAFALAISLFDVSAMASTSTGLAETAKNAIGKSCSELQLPSSNWCGYFVGYCINNSAVNLLAGEKISITDSRNPLTLVNWTCGKKNIGTYYSLSSPHYNRLINTYSNLSIISTTVNDFVPEAGDIIVFDWSGRNNSSQIFSHVGVVTDYIVSSAKVIYVDGNSGIGNYTYVSKTTLNKSYSAIIGYIRLKASVTYTITFDPNGGSVSPTSKTLAAGTLLTGMPTPTRNGYAFVGWTLDKIDPDSSNVQVSTIVSDGVFTFDKDTTLYAQWKRNCANHIYDADICTNCGAKLPYDNRFDASAAGTYRVSDATAYIRTGPYQTKDLVRTANRGETLQPVGSVINSYNNTWLKTTDGYYVHADKLTLIDEIFNVIFDDGSICRQP